MLDQFKKFEKGNLPIKGQKAYSIVSFLIKYIGPLLLLLPLGDGGGGGLR